MKCLATKHIHKHITATNKISHSPYLTIQWLCPLSLWVGQRHLQIMAPPLPYTILSPRAVGIVLAVVGLLAWGEK